MRKVRGVEEKEDEIKCKLSTAVKSCLKSKANELFTALDEGDIELLKTYVSNFAENLRLQRIEQK